MSSWFLVFVQLASPTRIGYKNNSVELKIRAKELCETERSGATLGSPSLTVRTVSVDTELDRTGSEQRSSVKVEVGVPNSP